MHRIQNELGMQAAAALLLSIVGSFSGELMVRFVYAVVTNKGLSSLHFPHHTAPQNCPH